MGNTTGQKHGGRIKGTPNKDTADIRAKMQEIVATNIKTLQADFKKLSESERIKYTLDMAKFCLPTLKSIEYQGEIIVTKKPDIEFKD